MDTTSSGNIGIADRFGLPYAAHLRRIDGYDNPIRLSVIAYRKGGSFANTDGVVYNCTRVGQDCIESDKDGSARIDRRDLAILIE